MICHRVQKGDTLSEIARKYNVTLGSLVDLNGISNPNKIYVGQVIQIPVKSTTFYNALITCLDAIEALPEFKQLMELIGK